MTTRDGKTYTGPLQLRDAQITVTTADGPRSFPFSAVLSADFKASSGIAPKPGHGLRGDYFVGRTLQKLQLTRIDPAIDYDWMRTIPHPSLVHSRAANSPCAGPRQLRPDHTEKYTLISNTDDGCRVYLDGKLIIDRWYDQAAGDTGKSRSRRITSTTCASNITTARMTPPRRFRGHRLRRRAVHPIRQSLSAAIR